MLALGIGQGGKPDVGPLLFLLLATGEHGQIIRLLCGGPFGSLGLGLEHHPKALVATQFETAINHPPATVRPVSDLWLPGRAPRPPGFLFSFNVNFPRSWLSETSPWLPRIIMTPY
jgi:hypothetical protein